MFRAPDARLPRVLLWKRFNGFCEALPGHHLDGPAATWQNVSVMHSRWWSLALFLSLIFPACRTWDETREEFVDPINGFLHQRYPAVWRTMVLEDILGCYSRELIASKNFRAEKQELLDRFLNIERATLTIVDLTQVGGANQARAVGLFRLAGVTAGDRRLSTEQRYAIRCERTGERWRITEEELLEEDFVYSGAPAFTEEAVARGLVFEHDSGGVTDKLGVVRKYAAGSGLAVGDYNDDGLEDVYLIAGNGAKLFRNQGDGTFEETTRAAGLDVPFEGEGRAAVFADYDSDGHTDLLVVINDEANRLYRNQGDGAFKEVGKQVGLLPGHETVGVAFADFNGDGRLDLYLVNGDNPYRKHPEPIYNALNATPNTLYMGKSDGTFTDATEKAGVGHTGWGLAVVTADYDLDGDMDIFVGNDVGYDILYRNRGDGIFDDVSLEAGISLRGSTMSVAWGDVNGDGYPDLFAPAMESNSSWMVDQPGFPSPAPWYLDLFIRPLVLDVVKEMFHGNRLYMNNGDGTFREVSEEAGVRRSGWAWSGNCLDYDHDGLLDLYCVNGFISGEQKDDL